ATPPFGKEVKKKNEFPDAITLNAIEEWAKQNNKKVLAIACDNDWKSYCEKSENIEYNDDLATVLAYLNTVNAPYVVLNQIENLIQHEDQKFYTSIAN
ncbi:PIN domain-containing protein, partial [Acinetobacter baumannii]